MSAGQASGDAAAARASDGRPWIDSLAVGLIVLIVGLSILDTLPVGAYFDDGMYVILAKSIATGHGYRWLQLPGTPPATHFPPGYPAVLALLWKLYPHFPANVVLFKAASVVFLAVAAAGVTVFARVRLGFSRWGAVAVGLASMLGLPTLILGAQVMSEPLFLALLFPVLLFAERVAETGNQLAQVIALGVVVGLVTLVRAHGIAIVAGAGLTLLLRRRIRDALAFGASAVAVLLPWQIWVRINEHALPAAMGGSYQPYSSWLLRGLRDGGPAAVVHTVAGVGREIGLMLALVSAPSMSRGVKLAAIGVVLGLCAVGLRRLWRRAPATAFFVAFYMAIVLCWPFTPSRFVWGIWPLVFLLPLLGALEVADWHPQARAFRGARLATLVCACLVGVGYTRYTARAYAGHWWSSITRQSAAGARPLVRWVRANTPASAVIASNNEATVYLYGERLSVPVAKFAVSDYFRSPTVVERADALRAILDLYHVDDVAAVAPDSVRVAMRAMASQSSPELVMVDTIANGVIYSPISHR